MKTCFKCHVAKPLSEFYAHSRMSDGHLNKCKSCSKRDVNTNRLLKHEYYCAVDRARAKTPERKALFLNAQRTRRKKHPEKTRAHNLVARAIKRGLLKKQPCETCGSTEHLHAHHDDYSKPLDVKWYCEHHHRAHEHRDAANDTERKTG